MIVDRCEGLKESNNGVILYLKVMKWLTNNGEEYLENDKRDFVNPVKDEILNKIIL